MDGRTTLWLLVGTIAPSFAIAWGAGFVVRRFAQSWGLVDRPGPRKVHTTPTPLGGGIAIWLGVVLPFALGTLGLGLVRGGLLEPEWVPEFVQPHLGGLSQQVALLWGLLGAGTVLMLVGLMDDRRGLAWQMRLGLEFAVAAWVVWQGPRLTAFIGIVAVTWTLSALWIVTLVNSFNMLDNMDGLSSGVATIIAGLLAAALLVTPDPETQRPQLFVAGFLLVLMGALLGFLMHNRPPARMFMGDAGSYFVGYSLAVATLLASYTSYRTESLAILAPVCVMAVPFYDLVTVLWIRVREGRSPFQGDKCHFSHRLVDLGLSKPQAVLTIYLTTATCGLGALLLPRVDLFGAAVVVAIVACVLALIAILEVTGRRKGR